ncbi:MAG: SDR family NAD(P)-dependent oxidoreductase [Anaerolineae bacterium]
MTSLVGKRALVTGASRGIGLSIAQALAEQGVRVAISARRQPDLDAALAQIEAAGGHGMAITCDVTDTDQIAALHEQIETAWGGLDILVSNAGSGKSAPFRSHPDALWHQMIAINLDSAYYITKAFAPAMLDQEYGRIINIASLASKAGGKYVAAYTAAKHGLLGLTRALAVEFAPHVTVNAICPGYVDTSMTDATIENIVEKTGRTSQQARHALEKSNPQNRLIEPDEVAAVAVMLAGHGARGITGQAINVDGGAIMY